MSEPLRIQLSRRKGFRLQEHSLALNGLPAAKVDRTTVFGNPFDVETFGLEGALARHKHWLESTDDQIRSAYQPESASWLLSRKFNVLEALPLIRGRNLACWCALGEPDLCHGAAVLTLANRPPRRVQVMAEGALPPNVKRIDKGIWTNPYESAPPDLLVALYRDHLRDKESDRARVIRERLPELRGYDLGCTCDLADPCHGDVLLELANFSFTR